MKLLTKEIEQKFAEVGSQEHLPDSKKKVIAKFFDPTGFYTWYALEYDPKYKECWDKFGDNVEYQLRTHLEKNDIEIIYLGNQRNFFHLYR